MNIEDFRNYCISKKHVSENFPFDKQTLVFKVAGKMFALCDIDDFVSINLKCDPELAIELREKHKGVTPGFHMNKKHWNTVSVLGDIPDSLLRNWIDHSYLLAIKSLPLKIQKNL